MAWGCMHGPPFLIRPLDPCRIMKISIFSMKAGQWPYIMVFDFSSNTALTQNDILIAGTAVGPRVLDSCWGG